MEQATKPSLAAQARALLADLEQRRSDPALPAELLSLALACHSRMLELGASDRPQAVALAIAGADLLQTLPGLSDAPSRYPAWVPVHEEQCCRYGAIWIHELLAAGDPTANFWIGDGLRLLNRMEQLHTTSIDWAATVRTDLLSHQDSSGSAACAQPQPPPPQRTLLDCIWLSDTPYQALIDLGRWVLKQSQNPQVHRHLLVEAAGRTRDSELRQATLDLLAKNPAQEPWQSLFLLQLQEAKAVDSAALLLGLERCSAQLQQSHDALDQEAWRSAACFLHRVDDASVQMRLQKLLSQLAPAECVAARQANPDPLAVLMARTEIAADDRKRAALLYTSAGTSLRAPFALWSDPEAADPLVLDALIASIRRARQDRRGFSMVRLGDGEGLFLCGRRPDLGGAISNGSQVEPRLAAQRNRLIDPEHWHLRQQLAQAVASADWIGIPDLQQCLNGPVDMVSVASGLVLMLSGEQVQALSPRLAVGGCHMHNFLLQAGCFAEDPFDRINAVIAPSLPQRLNDAPDLRWFKVPGELHRRADTFGIEAHYPRVFESIIAEIEASIQPADLVLVGAGILGKIYCQAIRARGGVAVDIGSVIDLCSGHGGTRGEYRLSPWLSGPAAAAFPSPTATRNHP